MIRFNGLIFDNINEAKTFQYSKKGEKFFNMLQGVRKA